MFLAQYILQLIIDISEKIHSIKHRLMYFKQSLFKVVTLTMLRLLHLKIMVGGLQNKRIIPGGLEMRFHGAVEEGT